MTSATTATSGRTRLRVGAILLAVAAALLLHLLLTSVAGIDLLVRRGGTVDEVGQIPTALVAALGGLAGWGLLAQLERRSARARTTWVTIASVVLLLSLAGPLGSAVGTGAKLALAGLHLVVGAVLIPLLGRSSADRSTGTGAR